MKDKMIIYTDSSWKNQKCDYAFSCHIPKREAKPTFIYGNCLTKTSTEAELIAVIKAMEYIKQYCTHLDNIKYEIRVDEQEIANFTSKKLYKQWNEERWKHTNGTHRRRNIRLWYKLMSLFESFQEGIIRFKKIKSKVDGNNFIVDRIAQHIANKSFIVSDGDYKSILSAKANIKTILINEYNFSEEEEEELITEFINEHDSGCRGNTVRWIDLNNEDTIFLPVEDIIVNELEHLNCETINFNGILLKLSEKNEIIVSIAVRRLDEAGKYSLVAGVKRLFSAKILGIKAIPAIITEMGHSEFVKKYR